MQQQINEIIFKSQQFNHKDEFLIKEQGAVFTTSSISNSMINECKPNITNKICEPSVGKGIFVFNLLEYFRNNGHTTNELIFFIENNLYCYDINADFITEFKQLLNNYVNILGYNHNLLLNNILNTDFLLDCDETFDLIIGNPPYIRIQNINSTYLEKLKNIGYTSVLDGNIDMYYVFIEKSLKISKNVSFIIPNTFIKNKSGKALRNILNLNLVKIYDNENNKVWNNISTYTCIIYCSDINTKSFEYVTNANNILIDKSDTEWIKKPNSGILNDLIINVSGSIATLKDDVYKFDYVDELYAYKKNIKIEKNICKEAYKSTTKETYWFIYPYDELNNIIDESVLESNYPLVYAYLIDNIAVLNNRDKGDLIKLSKYDNWYGYGRKQGMLKPLNENEIQIILPVAFLMNKLHHVIKKDVLVLSGISIILNEKNVNKFLEIVNSTDFQQYLKTTNKILHDNDISKIWLTLSTTSIKKF